MRFQELCELTSRLNKEFDTITLNNDTKLIHYEDINPYNSYFAVFLNGKLIIKSWSIDLLFKKLLKRGLI